MHKVFWSYSSLYCNLPMLVLSVLVLSGAALIILRAAGHPFLLTHLLFQVHTRGAAPYLADSDPLGGN